MNESPRDVLRQHCLTEAINLKTVTKHFKESILRYRGMKIDDKVADEVARHLAAVLSEVLRLSK